MAVTAGAHPVETPPQSLSEIGGAGPVRLRPDEVNRLTLLCGGNYIPPLPMKTYNVAVLGCGSRGAAAARAYYDHPRTRLVSALRPGTGTLRPPGGRARNRVPLRRPGPHDRRNRTRHRRHSDRHRIPPPPGPARARLRDPHRHRKNRSASTWRRPTRWWRRRPRKERASPFITRAAAERSCAPWSRPTGRDASVSCSTSPATANPTTAATGS